MYTGQYSVHEIIGDTYINRCAGKVIPVSKLGPKAAHAVSGSAPHCPYGARYGCLHGRSVKNLHLAGNSGKTPADAARLSCVPAARSHPSAFSGYGRRRNGDCPPGPSK